MLAQRLSDVPGPDAEELRSVLDHLVRRSLGVEMRFDCVAGDEVAVMPGRQQGGVR